MNRRGAIGIGSVIAIGSAILGSLAWMINYTNTAIAPVSAKADKADEAAMEANVKLDFLLGKYGAQYVPQLGKVITASSSVINE